MGIVGTSLKWPINKLQASAFKFSSRIVGRWFYSVGQSYIATIHPPIYIWVELLIIRSSIVYSLHICLTSQRFLVQSQEECSKMLKCFAEWREAAQLVIIVCGFITLSQPFPSQVVI